MGRNKHNEYRKVNELPANAMLVRAYAALWPCNTSYIYKLIRDSKLNKKSLSFEIVDFHGVNFVIPD